VRLLPIDADRIRVESARRVRGFDVAGDARMLFPTVVFISFS
jgi:hypothetical protein